MGWSLPSVALLLEESGVGLSPIYGDGNGKSWTTMAAREPAAGTDDDFAAVALTLGMAIDDSAPWVPLCVSSERGWLRGLMSAAIPRGWIWTRSSLAAIQRQAGRRADFDATDLTLDFRFQVGALSSLLGP